METIVVALSFGKPFSASGNKAIAEIAERIAARNDACIIADKSIPLKENVAVIFIGPPAEEHESTLLLAKQIATLVKVSDATWKDIIIVSAPDYMPRAGRDVEWAMQKQKIKFEAISWLDLDEADLAKNYKWYDPKSTQIWTRYRWLFLLREYILMAMPFWLYKKLTT